MVNSSTFEVLCEDPCGCKGAGRLILPKTALGSGEAILEAATRIRISNTGHLDGLGDGHKEIQHLLKELSTQDAHLINPLKSI